MTFSGVVELEWRTDRIRRLMGDRGKVVVRLALRSIGRKSDMVGLAMQAF